MSSLPHWWPWAAAAVLAFAISGALGFWLWLDARKRRKTLSDTAADLAEKHRTETRKSAVAEVEAAEESAAREVAAADEEARRATDDPGSLADHLRDLNSEG